MSLTDLEFEDLQALDREREQAGVAPLATSPQLQAIAEARVQKMVAGRAAGPGNDLSVDLRAAGLCVSAQHEVALVGPSLEESEGEDEGEAPQVSESLRFSSLAAPPGEEEAMQIASARIDPDYTFVGDAIIASEGAAYLVEDLAAPC